MATQADRDWNNDPNRIRLWAIANKTSARTAASQTAYETKLRKAEVRERQEGKLVKLEMLAKTAETAKKYRKHFDEVARRHEQALKQAGRTRYSV